MNTPCTPERYARTFDRHDLAKGARVIALCQRCCGGLTQDGPAAGSLGHATALKLSMAAGNGVRIPYARGGDFAGRWRFIVRR